ncbi:hypothetical protein GW17_00036788 [Ensete ventricosum]|nr:hypothetical protein GW17_00036788 [Ensete ventricosum]
MDLSTLRSMPKVTTGKSTPAAQVSPPLPEVEEVHVEVAPRTILSATPKRPVEKSTPHQEDPARTHERTKVVVRKHKSRHGAGGSRAPSKGKGPTTSSEEPTPLARRLRCSWRRWQSRLYWSPMSMDIGLHWPDFKLGIWT